MLFFQNDLYDGTRRSYQSWFSILCLVHLFILCYMSGLSITWLTSRRIIFMNSIFVAMFNRINLKVKLSRASDINLVYCSWSNRPASYCDSLETIWASVFRLLSRSAILSKGVVWDVFEMFSSVVNTFDFFYFVLFVIQSGAIIPTFSHLTTCLKWWGCNLNSSIT